MNENLRIERESDPVLRQAAEWALELGDTRTPLERIAEWQSWLAANVQHREAFSSIEELLGVADGARKLPWPNAQEVAADVYDGAISVSAWKASKLRLGVQDHQGNKLRLPDFRSFKDRVLLRGALAAALLLAVTLFVADYPRELNFGGLLAYKRVETPAGGTLKIVLTDGSAVDISGQSSLRTVFTRRIRTSTLEQGEAFFRVARDVTRPFVVRAGSTSVTAVGTAFNVRRSGERVVVSVVEGAVKVSSTDRAQDDAVAAKNLNAGQQLTIGARDTEPTIVTIDTSTIAGWRDGHLRYLNEPLSSVIVDIKRYTGREIELAEPAIGDLRITGTVLEHNLDGWLASLEETFPVHAARLPDGSIKIENSEK